MGTVEIFSTLGGIAAMTALLNARAQRLGDLLAGTYSQNERVPRLIAPVWTMPPELAQWAITADVALMPDPLSRRIVQFLKQSDQLTPAARSRLAGELAGEAARWVAPVPHAVAQAAPEAFLVAAVLVRREREALALALQAERLQSLSAVLAAQQNGFPVR
jgi:hypothetical protein